MAGRGLGGHRVEEGVKEEPQDEPDGEAHQHPSEGQPPVGQDHRGEDHGAHHKTYEFISICGRRSCESSHGEPGVPSVSAADRPYPEPCQALLQRQNRSHLWKMGIRDRGRDIGYALHNAGFGFPAWQPMIKSR